MANFKLTALALADLEEIQRYITEKENSATADRLIHTLLTTMESLAEMPGMGHKRPDLTKQSVRFWPVFSYLIVYQELESTTIAIVRVLGMRMQIASIL